MRHSVKKNVERYDPKKAEMIKKKHRELAEQRKYIVCVCGEYEAKQVDCDELSNNRGVNGQNPTSWKEEAYTLIFIGKLEVLTRENAKILQKIVEARQINVKARNQLVSSIKKDEDRSRSVRDSMARKNVRKQSEIAMDN